MGAVIVATPQSALPLLAFPGKVSDPDRIDMLKDGNKARCLLWRKWQDLRSCIRQQAAPK